VPHSVSIRRLPTRLAVNQQVRKEMLHCFVPLLATRPGAESPATNRPRTGPRRLAISAPFDLYQRARYLLKQRNSCLRCRKRSSIWKRRWASIRFQRGLGRARACVCSSPPARIRRRAARPDFGETGRSTRHRARSRCRARVFDPRRACVHCGVRLGQGRSTVRARTCRHTARRKRPLGLCQLPDVQRAFRRVAARI